MAFSAPSGLVIVTDDRFGDEYPEEHAVFDPLGVELRISRCTTAVEVLEAGRSADGLLVNLAPVDAFVLNGLEKCRGVVRYGIGMDNVDLVAAEGRGIPVRNVPGYCDDEAAEHALALLLDCSRYVSLRDRSVRKGRWNLQPDTRRLLGGTLGVFGYGGTGRGLVRRVLGLGFREILVWSRNLTQKRLESETDDKVLAAFRSMGTSLRSVGFEDVLRSATYLSLHVPPTPGAKPLLGPEEIALLPKGAILINTARGALVDEEALARALTSGALAAAGLDVFRKEPLPANSPLRDLPNVVLTDHAAWYSQDSLRILRSRAARNLAKLLDGAS